MYSKMKEREKLLVRQREINGRLDELDNILESRELNDEELKERTRLEREYESNRRELTLQIQEVQNRGVSVPVVVDKNEELRKFLREAPSRKSFDIPMKRSSISYGAQTGTYSGTGDYVQGITVVDLIDTERKDNDILTAAGVKMETGVVGNKIQWAYAGGVEAVFANELAATTERLIDLDKQNPVQVRLTVRVRISNQALENTEFDLQSYIVKHVADNIRQKINFAAASSTKAATDFYGGFAQNTESGTYGSGNYVPGKQAGTYTTFTKDTAAEMLGKVAVRNLSTEGCVFVMGAEDFWAFKVTPVDAGSGIMLIGDDNRLLGVPVVVCNAINRATQKGAVSGHNIGLGNFKYLALMQHGNLRLSVDGASAYASNTDEVITTVNGDFSMTVLKDGADAFVLYTKSSN